VKEMMKVMKNKNEIKEIILIQEKDENKQLKIKIGEFSSKKLVSILKKLLENTYQFQKIGLNREYVDIENVKYIPGESCLVFEANKEIYALYLGDEVNKLLSKILLVFNIQANKLIYNKINEQLNEDRYLIGGDSYKIQGFMVNGEIVIKEHISLYTIDLRMAYWKYNNTSINLQAIILENVTKDEVILQQIDSYRVVVDEKDMAYNQFFYKNSYLLFPIMISGNYQEELENFSNIGYYLYHMYMTYMENEKDEN
jgi:hypothetical protein